MPSAASLPCVKSSWLAHAHPPSLCKACQPLPARSQLAAEAKRLGLRPGRGGKWASDYELRGLVLAALLLEES